ncbi:MAG TPA: chloride channel protein [Ktedonobacteraceae bacterium]|nr:chloride channel protein [Ktedonobacteraceae bacterium]
MNPSVSTSLWQRIGQSISKLGNHEELGKLGDFTTTPRTALISLFAIFIGAAGAVIALILLRLIGLFTNLFFFQRWRFDLVSPAGNHLGIFEILVPVIGALIIGIMARYGSERIRGHGIPEAIEAILINGSKVEPKVAILKPLSSAISIGSGGPFGAEGPIIMTGGAFGSMIAQFFHLTSVERKTLLVAGAAAGMSATFASPVAAVLLAVELLLFEWKPRSLIPVALASAAAAIIRRYIIGMGPLFPTPPHPAFIGPVGMLSCVLVGLLAGALSSLLTVAVYASEDAFRKLPIHWMWWPAIGGLVIGLGGLIYPQALGVGYDTIGALLQGKFTLQLIVGVLFVKSIIWSVSLGSGTSGGVLAPLLMMGGALGGLESFFLPNLGAGFWPLISMGAILGGTMRSPFTGIIFVLELTHDVNVLLPLLIAVMIAHGFTVLFMRRSILTEKVSRRGYHLSREYAIDPLEIIFVREAMRTNIAALPDTISQADLTKILHSRRDGSQLQRLYPVLDTEGNLKGVVTRNDLIHLQSGQVKAPDGSWEQPDGASAVAVANGKAAPEASSQQQAQAMPLQLLRVKPVVAYPDEPLRAVVYRMAETGFTRFPVVARDNPRKLLGMISLNDLLKARVRSLEEERRRERILRLRLLFPFQSIEKNIDVEEVEEEAKKTPAK